MTDAPPTPLPETHRSEHANQPAPCPEAAPWPVRGAAGLSLLLASLLLTLPTPVRAQQPQTHVFVGGPLLLPAGPLETHHGIGPAAPYPALLQVHGIPEDHVVVDFEVVLVRLTHRFPDELDLLLVAPNGASTMLMSDVPGYNVTEASFRLRDGAPPMPYLMHDAGGTYAPTDFNPWNQPDVFPAPAPAGGWGTTLAPLTLGPVNGAWRLFAVDDGFGTAGTLDGWTLLFKTQSMFVDAPFPPTPGPTPPIPEPGTALLWALGLAALAWRARPPGRTRH